jgi:hypothetical protein
MDDERFGNNLLDSHPGVKRGHWILENHLQVASPLTKFVLRKVGEVVTREHHLPGCWLEQLQNTSTGCRLPTPRLTNESKRFSLIHGEIDTIDGFHPISIQTQIFIYKPL